MKHFIKNIINDLFNEFNFDINVYYKKINELKTKLIEYQNYNIINII